MRKVTNADIKKYEAMVEMYLQKYVQKNWNEASLNKHDSEVQLGNSGWTMNDFRQHLKTEVLVALQKYNPNYISERTGKSVKESTFVYQHLFNRTGQLMKKLTKTRYGYGKWTSNLEEVLWERDAEE
ncbi:MAG: hypothetical protein HWN81_00120 [Candidatus Lokiarchaeota archaeon]|nr:hypothetical protein [Candidatus Lokiarchaeota archaeon]